MTEQTKVNYELNLFCVNGAHLKSGEQTEITKLLPDVDKRRVYALASLLICIFNPESALGNPKVTTMVILPTLIKEFAFLSKVYLASNCDTAISNGEQMKAVKQINIVVNSGNPRIISEVLSAQLKLMVKSSIEESSAAFGDITLMAEMLLRNSVQCKIMAQAIARLVVEQHDINLSAGADKPAVH